MYSLRDGVEAVPDVHQPLPLVLVEEHLEAVEHETTDEVDVKPTPLVQLSVVRHVRPAHLVLGGAQPRPHARNLRLTGTTGVKSHRTHTRYTKTRLFYLVMFIYIVCNAIIVLEAAHPPFD